MYEIYAERSPSVAKIPIILEELSESYFLVHLDVSRGDQFREEFVALSSNSKIPVLIDHHPADAGQAITIWESGSILFYIADKARLFSDMDLRTRTDANTWLFWQASGLSPMCGQAAHFFQYDLPGSDYAESRYWKETNRLFGVLDRRLQARPFIMGDSYSIVDVACYPWIRLHEFLRQDLSSFASLERWAMAIACRPAVKRAYERIEALPKSTATREERFAGMCGHDSRRVNQR